MAHYDFDTVIDRSNTNALNTDGFRRYIRGRCTRIRCTGDG